MLFEEATGTQCVARCPLHSISKVSHDLLIEVLEFVLRRLFVLRLNFEW